MRARFVAKFFFILFFKIDNRMNDMVKLNLHFRKMRQQFHFYAKCNLLPHLINKKTKYFK